MLGHEYKTLHLILKPRISQYAACLQNFIGVSRNSSKKERS